MKKNILIVEDELLIAEDIKMNLEQLNYSIAGIAIRASEAMEVLRNNKVDLALLDINIKGELDGIELGQKIRNTYTIPIIYLTSNSDKRTVERAVATQPSGYVVKPYNKTDLFTTLALALHNKEDASENGTSTERISTQGTGNSAFFKIDGTFTKVMFNDINYFRTAGNYIEIYTNTGVLLVRLTVKELFNVVENGNFIRVHKSYILNKDKITGFNGKEVLIGDKNFPMGGVYKDAVFSELEI